MDLHLVEGPKDEMVSLKETKDYLRIDHDCDDNLIGTLIKSTREAIESVIQKTVMKRTWKYTIHSDSFNGLTAPNDNHPSLCGGTLQIPLPKPPVMKIIEVTINDKKIDAQYYKVHKIQSKFHLAIALDKLNNIKKSKDIVVLYEAGIAEDPDNVPYQLKLANFMLVMNAYQERYSYNSDGLFAGGVKELLRPFLNLRMF
ncbi:hypothetical protein FACS189449_06950 [Alphaproteobacteria bacterium]|nr:hypothetical protein FACS189449_06950 [Alphaproteobacteria bacterium]